MKNMWSPGHTGIEVRPHDVNGKEEWVIVRATVGSHLGEEARGFLVPAL